MLIDIKFINLDALSLLQILHESNPVFQDVLFCNCTSMRASIVVDHSTATVRRLLQEKTCSSPLLTLLRKKFISSRFIRNQGPKNLPMIQAIGSSSLEFYDSIFENNTLPSEAITLQGVNGVSFGSSMLKLSNFTYTNNTSQMNHIKSQSVNILMLNSSFSRNSATGLSFLHRSHSQIRF